ncbi:MAG: NUDIX domain-containing protein [Rhizobiaceae bacterium]
MAPKILHLTPDAANGPTQIADPWPLPATVPPVMIPGINPDGSFYPIEKIEAHVKGLHHLAISVFIFAGNELLTQRRALTKYHCGGQWANSCCTHPNYGEKVKTAATRRLTEELGFSTSINEKLLLEYSADVGNGLWERERVHMSRADVDKDKIKLDLNPEEVMETRWMTAAELNRDVLAKPDHYTPWFRLYLKQYPRLDF